MATAKNSQVNYSQDIQKQTLHQQHQQQPAGMHRAKMQKLFLAFLR